MKEYTVIYKRYDPYNADGQTVISADTQAQADVEFRLKYPGCDVLKITCDHNAGIERELP